MNVILYRVGRNLNRAYRTCEAFGVDRLELIEANPKLTGNLFKARDRVQIITRPDMPDEDGLLALETFFPVKLKDVNWERVRSIIIGGETKGLPKRLRAEQKAKIPMSGQISGLTVEATLAIALYEWKRDNE